MRKRGSVLLLIMILLTCMLPVGCLRSDNTEAGVANKYLRYFEQRNFEGMYYLLSATAINKISKDDFVKRYTSVFDAMGVKTLAVKKKSIQYAMKGATQPFEVTYDTEKCGVLTLSYDMDITQTKNDWTVNWTPALIFPDMQWGDRVVAGTITPKRGEIFDSGSELLATNKAGTTAYVKVEDVTDETVKNAFAAQAAVVLEVEAEKLLKTINSAQKAGLQLAALKSYPPDTLTPEQEETLLSIEHMGLDKSSLSSYRYYPHGEETVHLVGYTGKITAEDIADGKLDGYDQTGVVGRSGLEKAYDKELRGQPGWEIYIAKDTGARRSTVYRKDAVQGRDLVLTVDYSLQHKAYELMAEHFGDKLSGAVVVSDPETGAVKAAASWPTYNANIFSDTISKEVWAEIEEKQAQYNRFTQADLPPGSTFKPLTALMALKENIVTPDTVLNLSITNNQWNPDPKIPGWKIKRIPLGSGPLNLTRALVWSDNIYFAYVALQLKAERFTDYAKKFGFNEAIPFDLSVSKPQISNSGDLYNDALLADSGYGQGEILVSPLQLTSIYGIFGNNGTVMKPYAVSSFNDTVNGRHVPVSVTEPSVWRQDVADSSDLAAVRSILVNVVDDGTGYSAKVPGMTVAGKTGTAQMGSQDRAIGWYVGYVIEGGKKYTVTVCADGKTDDLSVKFSIAKGIFEELKTVTAE